MTALFDLDRIYELVLARRILAVREKCTYLRLQLRSVLLRDRLFNPALPDRTRTVLFVCQGNIIRSPFAAVLFSRLLPPHLRDRFSTASAGLDTTPGKTADPRALQLAKDFGVSLEHHRTQRLTPALVENADLIFVMDTMNTAKCLARHPSARDKLFMLGAFCDPAEGVPLDIRDPYSGSLEDVRQCYQTIALRLSRLAKLLASHQRARVPVETTPR